MSPPCGHASLAASAVLLRLVYQSAAKARLDVLQWLYLARLVAPFQGAAGPCGSNLLDLGTWALVFSVCQCHAAAVSQKWVPPVGPLDGIVNVPI